jgi:hypothetical protein
MKPDVEALCRSVGAKLSIVDYDELEEDDPVKQAVSALPTIRMRRGERVWSTYTPSEVESWRSAMMADAVSFTEDF